MPNLEFLGIRSCLTLETLPQGQLPLVDIVFTLCRSIEILSEQLLREISRALNPLVLLEGRGIRVLRELNLKNKNYIIKLVRSHIDQRRRGDVPYMQTRIHLARDLLGAHWLQGRRNSEVKRVRGQSNPGMGDSLGSWP
ncbi:hypothetical protein L3X38_033908 [Prunus dulcis]|uniref:Uncharacterized protein n=1 Tax=Prunus dulcis TaxID=3755 RepID=A0AAD4YXD1_PRUDU|nr:hypothetical protein L3X38_033908 [Prunus dulcis]